MPDRLTRPDSVILGTAAALLAASFACGLIVPPLFGFLLMASVVIAVVFLALCFPTGFCVAWLLIASMTLEMAVAVVACLPLAAADIRPLFVDSGGARLAGLGHPAFLTNVCLPAIYACLIQLYREGRRGDLLLLVVNFLILVATGARGPAAYAVAVTAISLISIRSRVFTARDRQLLVCMALAMIPVLILLAGDLEDIRLFNVAVNDTANLSGRELLWPSFENAAAQSPWVGWGVGAGNAVISPEGRIAQLLHTLSAHNEYLRLEVEGGSVGETLLIALFVGWTIVHTRRLWPSDRRIMRLALLALAALAFTDNVLISTPACVMFAFATAVFARPRPE
jgi:O-antigen ligase